MALTVLFFAGCSTSSRFLELPNQQQATRSKAPSCESALDALGQVATALDLDKYRKLLEPGGLALAIQRERQGDAEALNRISTLHTTLEASGLWKGIDAGLLNPAIRELKGCVIGGVALTNPGLRSRAFASFLKLSRFAAATTSVTHDPAQTFKRAYWCAHCAALIASSLDELGAAIAAMQDVYESEASAVARGLIRPEDCQKLRDAVMDTAVKVELSPFLGGEESRYLSEIVGEGEAAVDMRRRVREYFEWAKQCAGSHMNMRLDHRRHGPKLLGPTAFEWGLSEINPWILDSPSMNLAQANVLLHAIDVVWFCREHGRSPANLSEAAGPNLPAKDPLSDSVIQMRQEGHVVSVYSRGLDGLDNQGASQLQWSQMRMPGGAAGDRLVGEDVVVRIDLRTVGVRR